jgi:hypothetical protein
MSFETQAFDLDPQERHAILSEIKSLLLRTASLLAHAQQHHHHHHPNHSQKSKAPHDYAEALSVIDDALTLATDPDACDASLAPLATCHLYKGHVLLGLGRCAEAYDAYTLAAAAPPRALVDAPVARDAARRILALRGGGEKTGSPGGRRGAGVRGDEHGDGGRVGKKLGLAVLLADMALPVTLRPGPVRRRPWVVVREGREKAAARGLVEDAAASVLTTGDDIGRSGRWFITSRSPKS